FLTTCEFNGSVPSLSDVVDKVAELSGLGVTAIASSSDETSGLIYAGYVSLALIPARRVRLLALSDGAGAESGSSNGGIASPAPKRCVVLDASGFEATLPV